MGFYSTFEEQPDQQHPLYILFKKINWLQFEGAFAKHYSHKMGAPAKALGDGRYVLYCLIKRMPLAFVFFLKWLDSLCPIGCSHSIRFIGL